MNERCRVGELRPGEAFRTLITLRSGYVIKQGYGRTWIKLDPDGMRETKCVSAYVKVEACS